ncbi:DUF5979 domain-containing protein [Acetatifactor muris]|uniref:DUF5979 domain-containing protein n=1 Tax=Acetatifactor muris TaxID=879566 RepID=A0A2K4ZFQ8_9FIRM|nr:DUF5979 domain-containing protein [Acetatifactor muris]MCR2047710.1 DUF5979 domain-containing protein [Acetatifactor muris]SOY29282.1 hypothetical protein AMURIS_01997 [Acetatifactor muris]
MAGKKKRAKSTGVLILGLAVLIGALTAGPGRAYGAGAIDTERKDCKITFTLDVEALEKAGELAGLETAAPGYEQYYGELAAWLKGSDAQGGTEAGEQEGDTAPGQEEGNVLEEPGEGSASGENAIQAELYRIAEVNAGGKYTLLAPWKTREALKGVETADADTTAGEWLEWAQAAAETALGTEQEDGSFLPPEGGRLLPDKSAEIRLGEDGKVQGAAEDLETGLYLVWVKPVDTDFYRYSFIPYLISLPNNYYNPEDADSSDVWIYGDDASGPVYVGLKPEREDRYGDLEIEKKLASYNETLKGASFVFEIRGVKDSALVYSDVVSLTFDGPGRESVKIEHIPAGAEVTVTEVYSGGSYSPVDGATVKTTVIQADSAGAKVVFENEYDGKLNGGGASVVNHFIYEKDETGKEDLKWEKLENSNGVTTR